MSYKVSASANLFVGIIFLFALVFALFSLMDFFAIPLPTMVTPVLNLSILYCIQPIYILFVDLLGVSIGPVGEYLVFFFDFSFFLLIFIFSIALGVRQILNQRSKALTLFVQVLHVVNMICALLTIILYLIIDYFIPILLIPSLGLFVISLLAFICNLGAQKSRMLENK